MISLPPTEYCMPIENTFIVPNCHITTDSLKDIKFNYNFKGIIQEILILTLYHPEIGKSLSLNNSAILLSSAY